MVDRARGDASIVMYADGQAAPAARAIDARDHASWFARMIDSIDSYVVEPPALAGYAVGLDEAPNGIDRDADRVVH